MNTPRNRPTGVDELTPIRTVSPVPEHLRVAVFGGSTQLDITLPADVRIADVAPYLARLIAQRERTDDEPAAAGPELTSRTVLHTAAGAALPADVTLRDAGVRHGDMLYLSAQRTLHPPALYDDVVDAAAQLNRAASAAWGPASAAVMAIVALYACVGVLVWMSVDPRFAERHAVIVGLDVAGGLALVAGATVARRIYHWDPIAACFGWAAMLLGFGALWAVFAGVDGWGPVACCAGILALNYGCYRLIGTGRWGSLAGGGFAALVGAAWALRTGLAIPDRQLWVAVCLAALALAFWVPWLTRGWDRFVVRVKADGPAPNDQFADPFNIARGRSGPDLELADTVPGADEVLRRGREAAAVRCGLYTAAGAALAVGAQMLAHTSIDVVALAFTMLCGIVFALQLRTARSTAEQAALLIFGVVVVVSGAITAATFGSLPATIVGLVALGTLLVGGAVTGVLATTRVPAPRHRLELLLDYVGYIAVGALIPVALAVVGLYDAMLGR
ncbi:type VII secretion integral membrane protein EccD [Mycobacterium sp. 852013-50091_SCH5140682]|uniref:type VII secretion integral membrane protein EccD n=1 Tax=Mycobacterium sp. 852013-50091_SCH5140682 TaxID=1834109 RepID=UPI0007EB3A59|nr:type VII secretion integral membrane protein EccD [Mycobacterium sp. 852013-50091_SCH5140682]OBC15482.1 type VII secretion integral membrane protein EccD [Mycobacterium sp. 852013-50091_SCH5140682]